jgi:hypothetical protein
MNVCGTFLHTSTLIYYYSTTWYYLYIHTTYCTGGVYVCYITVHT